MTAWALIGSGVVVNCVQANDPPNELWLAAVTSEYDWVIDITSLDPRPGIGWTYDGNTFSPPSEP